MEINKIRPVVLCILDGWGISIPGPSNAISQARLPNLNKLLAGYANGQLTAAGEAVGLPHGEDGNTEVGHLNLGAGHIVDQDLPRINMAIADGSFFQNRAFLAACEHVKTRNSNLHLMGLIGSGGVHSSIEHLYALMRLCHEQGVRKVFLHLFTDGRDSPPNEAGNIIAEIEEHLKKCAGFCQIATISGRYYAMDRDNRWERTKVAYDCLTFGIGQKAHSAQEAVAKAYDSGQTDEFILPTNVVDSDNHPIGQIKDHDAVIFTNYRIDRPRQLTKAFVIPEFETMSVKMVVYTPFGYEQHTVSEHKEMTAKTFDRGRKINDLFFVTMTEYERNLPIMVAFPPTKVLAPIGYVLSSHGASQLHVAETEKERFVTYYFNGLREDAFPGEERIIIPSAKVATYDLKPEMSAYGITDVLEDRLRRRYFDFFLVNYANPDMVGHTGVISAAIRACEVVDECIGRLVMTTLSLSGAIIITADHGNVEEMINPQTGEQDTEHSSNPVPVIAIANNLRGPRKFQKGILADVAPTILSLMGIPKPAEMTGRNLLQ
jgi:2,3-bisphosphoglycerate-independent phosphoglycerate mutase